jgi:hypothetical protein
MDVSEEVAGLGPEAGIAAGAAKVATGIVRVVRQTSRRGVGDRRAGGSENSYPAA